MINNDFNEEYYRDKLPTEFIDFNPQSFTKNSSGSILYTPNYISESDQFSLTSRKFALGRKIPESTNLIIDAVTILSTNPDVENYFPLKMTIGGKIEIEISAPFDYKLNNWKVYSRDQINLRQIINQSFSKDYDLIHFEQNDFPSLVAGNNVYSFASDDKNAYIIFSNNSIARIELGTKVIVTDATANRYYYPRIYCNSQGSYAIFRDTLSNDFYLLNFKTFVTTPLIGVTAVNFLNAQLLNRSMYVSFYDAGGNAIVILEYCDDELVVGLVLPVPVGGIPIPDAITFFDVEGYIYYLYFDNVMLMLNIYDNAVPTQIYTGEIEDTTIAVGNVYLIGLGGRDRTRFNISLLKADGFISSYVFDRILQKYIKVSDIEFYPTNPVRVKRYLNNFYVLDGKKIIFFNLDTLVKYELDVYRIALATPKQFMYINNSSINFLYDGLEAREILFIDRGHLQDPQRTATNVYKVSYDYDERIYPFPSYDSNLSIKFSLPNNNPIEDMEIFQFIIDYRVRFSKAMTTINPAFKCENGVCDLPTPVDISKVTEDECSKNCEEKSSCAQGDRKCEETTSRRCFTLCNRQAGNVSDILGLVDQNFAVSDLLNLYVQR